MSPTARSLQHLREQGYRAEVVEHTVPHTLIKNDLIYKIKAGDDYGAGSGKIRLKGTPLTRRSAARRACSSVSPSPINSFSAS